MKPLYAIGRALTTLIFRIGGARVIGREHIPKNEAVMIVCNHVSFADPPAVTMVYPGQLTYIAKEGFGKKAWTRWLFSALGAVFLNKDANDLTALRAVIKELKAGRSVVIYPEGGRHLDHELGEFMPGAAFIALKSGVRILPMALVNTGDFWRFWKRNIVVNIGEPLTLPAGQKTDKALLRQVTETLRDSVGVLLGQAKAKVESEGRKMRTYQGRT